MGKPIYLVPDLIEFDYGDFLRPPFAILKNRGWGQCTNLSGEELLVYGPKHESDYSIFDTSPYLLPHGATTPSGWDCDGFFVPNDRVVREPLRHRRGPLAVKFWDFRHFIVSASLAWQYECSISNGHFEPSQINWPIPNFSYAQLMQKRAIR